MKCNSLHLPIRQVVKLTCSRVHEMPYIRGFHVDCLFFPNVLKISTLSKTATSVLIILITAPWPEAGWFDLGREIGPSFALFLKVFLYKKRSSFSRKTPIYSYFSCWFNISLASDVPKMAIKHLSACIKLCWSRLLAIDSEILLNEINECEQFNLPFAVLRMIVKN